MEKQLTPAEVKATMVDILSDIHHWCETNGTRYYLAFGTLLGAVRHQGFIPWDDDIDIWMPRPDYDRFLKEYRHDHFKAVWAGNTPDYPLDFAKVHDTRPRHANRRRRGRRRRKLGHFRRCLPPGRRSGRNCLEKDAQTGLPGPASGSQPAFHPEVPFFEEGRMEKEPEHPRRKNRPSLPVPERPAAPGRQNHERASLCRLCPCLRLHGSQGPIL